MKTCPYCKYEFDELEKTCPKCSADIDEKSADAGEEWVILTTVKNNIEFEMVAGVLGMGNIPVIQNVKGIDGFVQIILGVPLAGIDVLVPTSRLEEAKQLLEASVNQDEIEDET